MFSVTTIVLSLSLLACQTLAAPNPSGPSRHARWGQVPRTLIDPEYLKRDNLGAREAVPGVGFSPFDKKDIFQRQTGSCSATEVECQGNKCCPAGFNCYYVGSIAACCPVGQTCSGLPVGCADPNSLECPASIGGCCPIGQQCYIDSTGVARCDNTGLYSTPGGGVTTPVYTPPVSTPVYSPPVSTPVYTPPVSTPVYTPPVTNPVYTPPVTTPAYTPPTTTPTRSPTDNQATVAGVRSGAEKVVTVTGMGALAAMMGALVGLA